MARDDPHFRLRLPNELKKRVEESARRHGRSVNAEIVQALSQIFPPEPSLEELMEYLSQAIHEADRPGTYYRKSVIDALQRLERRLDSGIEFDRPSVLIRPPPLENADEIFKKVSSWKRFKKEGVEQASLDRELEDGLLHRIGGDRLRAAIVMFKKNKPERAMMSLGLSAVEFQNFDAATKAIEANIRKFYKENFEPDPDFPTDLDDEMYDKSEHRD